MLTLLAEGPECLWDDALPIEVRQLPEDLAALDVLLSDHEFLWPLVERWQREFRETGRLVLTEGRPTIPLESYIRLMVLKQRYRWRVPDAGGGGVGLDPSAAVLSDLAERAGAGRVDGAQADAADWCRDGLGADAGVDRQGDPGEAVGLGRCGSIRR